MNTVYSDLIARFSTSEALFAYLRSEEGGNLIVRDDHLTADLPLTIIFYDKKRSDRSKGHVGAFRSVVWNALTNRPVAAGPHHGLALTETTVLTAPYVVEDFVDGTMINQWWNGTAWQVSTRTQLDAGGSFYGKRSFATLFAETFAAAGLNADEHLDKSVVYSWVLQHPEERIVVAPTYGIPKLVLVERTQFDAAGNRQIITSPLTGPLATMAPATHTGLATVADIHARVAATGRRLGAGWQGVVVKLAGGDRYKLRSVQYNAARMLRGNQAKRQFLWLERWSEGKLPAYLKIYPEEEHDAMAIVTTFKNCTQEFHDTYLKVFKHKTLKLKEAPIKYRKLIWEARQANTGTYFPSLRDFLNKQDTARKLWLVNFEKRYAAGAAPGATGGGSAVASASADVEEQTAEAEEHTDAEDADE